MDIYDKNSEFPLHNLYEREFLVYRISCGYITYPDLNLQIYSPDKFIKYRAQEKYIDTYTKAVGEWSITEEEALDFLIELELWSEKKQELLDKIIPEKIDNLKVDMYNCLLESLTREKIRKELRTTEKYLHTLSEQRHQFDYMTCEGIATYSKSHYIIENCTKHEDGRLYDWSEIDVHSILNFIHSNHIDDKKYRILAKTEPWQSMYGAAKKNGMVFNKDVGDLTDEQRRLIAWTSLYDSIHENPEAPHESIVDDDDMLDGWLILQRREREKNQKQKGIESKLTDKVAQSQEIFVFAQTPEDAKAVEDMNSANSKMIKRQRMEVAKAKGEAKDSDFLDRKLEIQMLQNQAYIEKTRGQ